MELTTGSIIALILGGFAFITLFISVLQSLIKLGKSSSEYIVTLDQIIKDGKEAWADGVIDINEMEDLLTQYNKLYQISLQIKKDAVETVNGMNRIALFFVRKK